MRKPSRPTAAITLIELITTTALMVTALSVVLGVVIVLNEQTSSELSRAELDRTLVVFDSQIAEDLNAARPCQPDRTEPVVRAAGENLVSWTMDADNSGNVEQVTWRLDGNQLVRATAIDQGNCTFPAPTAPCGDGTSCSVAIPSASPDDGGAVYPNGTVGLWVTAGSSVDVLPDPNVDPDQVVCGTSCVEYDTVQLRVQATARNGSVVPISRDLAIPTDRSRLTR